MIHKYELVVDIREQDGTYDGLNFKQKKKDNRKLKERLNAEANKKPDDMEEIEELDDDWVHDDCFCC